MVGAIGATVTLVRPVTSPILWSRLRLLAPLTVQLKVLVAPTVMVDGVALKEAMATETTVTVTVAVVVAPDALDAVSTSRLRDAYELLLLPRLGLLDSRLGLPVAKPDLAALADPAARLAALQDAVLNAWPAPSADGLDLLPEQPPTIADRTSVFLGRVLIPVKAANPPERDGTGVLVDNWSRRLLPSLNLLAHWLGA